MVTVFTSPTPGLPSDWVVEVPCGADDWAQYSGTVQTAAAQAGAMMIWAATGRRYGLYTHTCRPCATYGSASWQGIAGYWLDNLSGSWMPYLWSGQWRNCWAGCTTGCGCKPASQVWIDRTVNRIISVDLAGSVMPSGSYRVDNGQWMVRTDGDIWPIWQDLSANPGEPDTWTVTYQSGFEVPAMLSIAAGHVALEWAKACAGQGCALPSRVTSVVRQGVSIEAVPVENLLQNGLTGILWVDQMIRTFNPHGLARQPRVMSPDLQVPRVTTWP